MVGVRNGFTLIEAVVALAVAAIVLATVGPFARSTMASYQRNATARQVLSDIRRMQSMAVTRGGVFVFQWGGDPAAGLSANQYRLVRDTTAACGLPATSAVTDGTNVVQSWRDLRKEYPGVSIQSIKDSTNANVYKVMFNSLGASVNTCVTTSFPVTVTIADATGTTKTILIQSAGGATPQ